MAFETLELSNYDGAPIQLYEFQRTSGGIDFFWRYCTADTDVVYDGNTYTAIAISDDGVRQSGEAVSTELHIVMPVIEDVPAMYMATGFLPSDILFCRMRRLHSGDTDARLFWVGTVSGVAQIDEVQAKISCNAISASFKRGGLRLSWTRGCPHMLYDRQCKADPNTFNIDAIVDSLDGNSVESTAFGTQASGWLDGGYLEWVLPSGLTERRSILTHSGTSVRLSGSTSGITVADSVVAFAGCRRVAVVCNDKFNNLPNYGGFVQMPGVSPFSSNGITSDGSGGVDAAWNPFVGELLGNSTDPPPDGGSNNSEGGE